MINKNHLVILLVIIIITTVIVVVLKSIRPSINTQVDVSCEQIKFDLIYPEKNSQPISILNSSLWLKEATVVQFNKIIFKSPVTAKEPEFARYCNEQEFIISPNSSESYVKINSQNDAFSLCDILIASDVSISWSMHEDLQNIIIQQIDMGNRDAISMDLSTGDSLWLSLYNCQFVNNKGEILYVPPINSILNLTIPISFATQRINIVSNPNRLEVNLAPQEEIYVQDVEILRELNIRELNFNKTERSSTLELLLINTILRGTIRRPSYGLRDLIEIQKGDYIKPIPSYGILKSLLVEANSLNLLIEYKVQSMKIGPYEEAEHELVKSQLEIWLEDPTLTIIYTITMVLFAFVINFVIKKKTEK